MKSQPQNQVCVIESGKGKIGGAAATNIRVTCATVAVDPALDPSFGVAGVVSKIVMVGGGSLDFTLARYLADGTLDPSFGSAGLVTTDLGSASEDEAHAVALQPDGKIVVAGHSVTGLTQVRRDLAPCYTPHGGAEKGSR